MCFSWVNGPTTSFSGRSPNSHMSSQVVTNPSITLVSLLSHRSISLSHSMIVLNLIPSYQSFLTKWRSSFAWAHFHHMCPLLQPTNGMRAGHMLQPDTWMAACFLQSSVWEAVSDLVEAGFKECHSHLLRGYHHSLVELISLQYFPWSLFCVNCCVTLWLTSHSLFACSVHSDQNEELPEGFF